MAAGASHVDWAISMGLFVVYILSLFIFLRPGIEEISDRTVLLDILEDGFHGYINHKIDKTPIFINTSKGSGKYALEIKFKGEIPFNGDDEDFTMVDKDDDNLPFELSKNNKKINFNATILGNNFKNLFWLIYIENASFNNVKPLGEFTQVNDTGDFNYRLGVTESIIGIDEEKLDSLENVEDLKEVFNYPEANGFLINIVDSGKINYTKEEIIKSYQAGEINDENVFVKESRDFILYKNGTRKKIIINFRAW